MEIINVMAASLDAHIASEPYENDASRRSYGFTNEEDKEFVRSQIQNCDAVVTGASSMCASGGAWNEVGRAGKPPHWYVLSKDGLPKELAFWQQTQIPRTIVSPKPVNVDLLAANQVTPLVYQGESPVPAVLQDLAARSYQRVLLFGGGFINQLFYEAAAVDELLLTLCPLFIGRQKAPSLIEPELPAFVHFELLSSKQMGSHLFLRYKVKK